MGAIYIKYRRIQQPLLELERDVTAMARFVCQSTGSDPIRRHRKGRLCAGFRAELGAEKARNANQVESLSWPPAFQAIQARGTTVNGRQSVASETISKIGVHHSNKTMAMSIGFEWLSIEREIDDGCLTRKTFSNFYHRPSSLVWLVSVDSNYRHVSLNCFPLLILKQPSNDSGSSWWWWWCGVPNFLFPGYDFILIIGNCVFIKVSSRHTGPWYRTSKLPFAQFIVAALICVLLQFHSKSYITVCN